VNNVFLPAGSQDQIGQKLDNQAKVNQVFRSVVLERNYKAIETPVVEYANTFMNKHVGMELRTMLKWFNREGEIEVLRPDWTTAIARALVNQDSSQLKWFYQGSVFRNDKDGTESRQAGIEIIRTTPLLGEMESLFTAVSFLKSLNINDYLIELGHTGIFEHIIAPLALTEREEEELRQAMYNKRKDVVYQFAIDKNHEEIADLLTTLINAYGGKDVLTEYRNKWANQSVLVEIIDHLIKLVSALDELGVPDVIVDLGRVKQLPYYCGTMFRGYLTENGTTCFSGGRYDKLYEQFNEKISAVGLAFDVDVLTNVIEPIKQKQRICLLATEATHVEAEKRRVSYSDQIVDIQYVLAEEHHYDQVINVNDIRNKVTE
jgi:ATP phosphoribosyltransferase regulatory subunit